MGKAESRNGKIKSQKFGKQTVEIADFELAVLQISAFNFSSINTPRPRSLETRPRKTHPVGKAAPVAGGADPGRGAERLTERLLSRQTLGSRGAAEHAERIPSSSLRALRASA